MPRTSPFNRTMINNAFVNGVEFNEEALGVRSLLREVNSLGFDERYIIGSTPPMPTKDRGPVLPKRPSGKPIDIRNERWSSAVGYNYDDMINDQSGTIERQSGDLALRLAQHKVQLLTDLIEAGNTSAVLGFDGVNYFNGSHVHGSSGTQSNLLTNSEVPALNVSAPTAVTAEEMADAALGVIAHMKGFKDDEGQPMHETARVFRVMVPTEIWAASAIAGHANLLNQGSDNPIVAVRRGQYTIIFQENARLSSGTVFYTFRADGPLAPYVLQIREDTKLMYLGEDSDHFFHHNEYLVKGTWFGNVGPGHPLYAARATLS